MASADEAVSEELVAARSQIATLTFEARDMEAVNRTLLIKVGKLEATLEKHIQHMTDMSEHQLKEMQLATGSAQAYYKWNKQLTEKVEQLTTENAELIKENSGLWHEVVGWAVQDCKRRRLK